MLWKTQMTCSGCAELYLQLETASTRYLPPFRLKPRINNLGKLLLLLGPFEVPDTVFKIVNSQAIYVTYKGSPVPKNSDCDRLAGNRQLTAELSKSNSASADWLLSPSRLGALSLTGQCTALRAAVKVTKVYWLLIVGVRSRLTVGMESPAPGQMVSGCRQ